MHPCLQRSQDLVISLSTARPTVYVVDDDFGVLGSLRFLLETDGFEVEAFRSGSALLNAAASVEVDCFAIDYKMPKMSYIKPPNPLPNQRRVPPITLTT